MDKIERFQIKEYDGTKEAALQVLKDLKVKDDFYHFNLENGQLFLHSKGLILNPGDCYEVRTKNEKFEAVG